jgi:hypothetical protein
MASRRSSDSLGQSVHTTSKLARKGESSAPIAVPHTLRKVMIRSNSRQIAARSVVGMAECLLTRLLQAFQML